MYTLIIGIILSLIGRKFYNKREKTNQVNNSGVFFQLDTIFLYSGFIIILVSILSLVLK